MPDILKALITRRASFQAQLLEVPVAIVLKDAEEAVRLQWYLRGTVLDVRPYVEEDVVISTMKIMLLRYAGQRKHLRYLVAK